jgi:hypothetical protein
VAQGGSGCVALTNIMGSVHWECRGAHVPRCRQLCKGPCTGAGSGGGGGGRRAPGPTTAAHGAAAGATRPRTPTGGGASTICSKAHTNNNTGHKHTTSPGLHTSVCRQWLRHITTKAWTEQQGGRNTAQSHHNEKCKKEQGSTGACRNTTHHHQGERREARRRVLPWR